MGDERLAEQFNVSNSTISRSIRNLESKGYITRTTKNIKGGRERVITINLSKIEADITNVKMKVDGCQQASNCLLTNVKLTIDNRQNDFIKDNIEKDNSPKDNIKEDNSASAELSSLKPDAELVSKDWLVERIGEIIETKEKGLYIYKGKYYRMDKVN